jgi:multidrug resistance efflux pump
MPTALQALNGGTPGVRAQLSQYQAQLQQARREASQAADRVSQLEQQAAVARQESARADDRVRGLESQPPRSDSGNSGTRKRINTLSQLSGTVLDVTA